MGGALEGHIFHRGGRPPSSPPIEPPLCSATVDHHVAGPQSYNVSRGMAAESLYKAYLASTLHGAFGSSAERKGPVTSNDSRDLPGPAHYQPPIAATCHTAAPRGRIVRATSNFASHSDRIKKPEHRVCDLVLLF